MKILGTAVCLVAILLCSITGNSTPSSTYWTPCTLDMQAPGVTHITLDNYNTFGSEGSGSGGESFPTDYGLTWGAKLGDKLAAEFGFDYFAPADDPLFFNAKIGFTEGTLSRNAPAIQLGLFNFGTNSGVTNQNIIHLIIGKSLPNGQGRLSASYYIGNSDVLRSSTSEKANTGFMIAYDRVITDKIIFAADYASGENAIGGGGAGLYYYFNKNTSLLVGPVWFNDEGINGKTKWTVQLDINF